jgi:hypothetical protein
MAAAAFSDNASEFVGVVCASQCVDRASSSRSLSSPPPCVVIVTCFAFVTSSVVGAAEDSSLFATYFVVAVTFRHVSFIIILSPFYFYYLSRFIIFDLLVCLSVMDSVSFFLVGLSVS